MGAFGHAASTVCECTEGSVLAFGFLESKQHTGKVDEKSVSAQWNL